MREPDHDRGVRFVWFESFRGGPGVWHVGRHQDQVRRLLSPYVIADKAPTAAIQRERQLVLGMVVPFERYF